MVPLCDSIIVMYSQINLISLPGYMMRSRAGAVFLRSIYGFLGIRVADLSAGVTAVGGPFAHFPFGVVTIFWCLLFRTWMESN